MKIEKLPSGTYRVRKTFKGKTYTFTSETKPTQKQITEWFSQKITEAKQERSATTFQNAAEAYISVKQNVLSESTIREYKGTLNRLSDGLKCMLLDDVDEVAIQNEINELAKNRSAKTVRNYHGFISAVLSLYKPSLVIRTTLPQKVKHEPYIPTDEDVKRIIERSRTHMDGMYYVAIVLACFGMRRSEICAITTDDVSGNAIRISKALVLDENNNWVIKATKTTESTRDIIVPMEIADLIRKNGYAYKGHPNSITEFLYDTEKLYGIPKFSIHKLRHYFCSRLASNNVDMATIMALGGWKSDYVPRQVYRHVMADKLKRAKEDVARDIATSIL